MDFNIFRAIALFPAALTFALAIANLVVSFMVLRPKPLTWNTWWGSGAGFLWLHIVCVVVPFQGFVAWGMIEVIYRFGENPPTFRAPLLIFLCTVISLGYVIIFRVELARLKIMRRPPADVA